MGTLVILEILEQVAFLGFQEEADILDIPELVGTPEKTVYHLGYLVNPDTADILVRQAPLENLAIVAGLGNQATVDTLDKMA